MHPATERRPDDDRHRPISVRAVARPRGFADDLVEGRVDEVGELDLGDRDHSVERRPDRDADDRRLGERRVEHPSFAETSIEPVGGPEDAALAPDVLTKHEHPVVALHLFGHGRAHRFDHPHGGHQ